MCVVAAFAVLASLLSLQLAGPRPLLGRLDAPRVVATIGYAGPGYSGALSFSIRARGGTIRPQRGTHCDRSGSGWICEALPLHSGATEWLSFLVTGLRPGTPLVVTAQTASTGGHAQAVLRRPVR